MEDISVAEMKKVLKKANLYEENMSVADMIEYYKTILISEASATEEKENNDYRNSTLHERSFSHIFSRNHNLSLENDKPKSADTNGSQSKNKNRVMDATNAFVPFEDMPKSEEVPGVEIVEYPLKFVNIQNSQAFQESSTNQKAKMLYAYHTHMAKERSKLYRKSFFSAPLPKPIMLKVSDEVDEEVSSDNYVSRFGRQQKRIYYHEEYDDAIEHKKQKSEIEADLDWTSSGSVDIPQLKQDSNAKEATVSQLNTSQSQRRLISSEMDNNDSLFKPTTIAPLRKLETSVPKVWKDKPSPSELLFDQLRHETEVKKKEMEKQQSFEKTSFDDKFQTERFTVYDEPVRRRIVPPLHVTRRGSKNKKSSTSKDQSHPKSSTKIPKHAVLQNELDKPDLEPDCLCPICQKNFPLRQLEAHAATCVNYETSAVRPKHVQSEAMTCNICDMVVTSNYIQHVSSCIQIQDNQD